MFKLLTFIVLGYFAYRYFIKPFFPSKPKSNLLDDEPYIKGGEFIEYEEVQQKKPQ